MIASLSASDPAREWAQEHENDFVWAFNSLLGDTEGAGRNILCAMWPELLPSLNGDFFAGANMIVDAIHPNDWVWPAFSEQIGDAERQAYVAHLAELRSARAEEIICLASLSEMRTWAAGRAKARSKDELAARMKENLPTEEFEAYATDVRNRVLSEQPDVEYEILKLQALTFLRRVFALAYHRRFVRHFVESSRRIPNLRVVLATTESSLPKCNQLAGAPIGCDDMRLVDFAPCERLVCHCTWKTFVPPRG